MEMSRAREFRRGRLANLRLLLVGALLWVLCGGAWWLLFGWYARGQEALPDTSTAWISYGHSRDGKPGDHVSIPVLQDSSARQIWLKPRARPLVVVFLTRARHFQWSDAALAEELHRAHAQLDLYGIYVPGSQRRASWFADAVHSGELQLGFPVLIDAEGRAARALNVFFSPRVYVFDAQGTLRYVQRHGADKQEIGAALEAIAREGGPSGPT